MKNLEIQIMWIPFILFFFSSTLCGGQNWNLINTTDRFHYGLNGSTFITATLTTDSIREIDGDTTFYLNRIVVPCDTCDNIETAVSYNCNDCPMKNLQVNF